MDSELIPGDVVCVNGSLFKEQKFHHTDIFVGEDLADQYIDANGTIHHIQFFARVLVATAGAANAGLDSSLVRFVLRDGFPPSLQDLIQELGRAARYVGATAVDNTFLMIVSPASLFALFYRIFYCPGKRGSSGRDCQGFDCKCC
jgi:hypothetical protein